MSSPRSLIEALTTQDISDGNGIVEVNIADGLFAIAAAIGRLAAVQERNEEQRAQDGLIADALKRREGHT